MNIREETARPESLIRSLAEVWEQSVRTTHLFLTPEDIRNIAGYVPGALAEIPHLVVAWNDFPVPAGFIGTNGDKIEMLFITPQERGCGIGKCLLRYAVKNYAVTKVCVNEQNPAAKGFYEHMGFKTYKRTELDEQGNPFPLLYMKRPDK